MFNNITNWDAVSAIGSWLGSIATFSATIIALYPYLKKGKLYFSIWSNLDQGPVLNIVNSRPEGMIIEKIVFYAGPVFLLKKFFVDEFLEGQDDLVSDKSDNYIEPYGHKKIEYNCTRIIHFMCHSGLKIGIFSSLNLRIVLYSNVGRIKMNTKVEARKFLESILSRSEAYNNLNINQII